MKRIATFIALTTFLTSALANELFGVRTRTTIRSAPDIKGQVATVSGSFDGIKISLVVTVSDDPPVPSTINVQVGDHSLTVEKSHFHQSENPRLKDISVIADSGVFGTYFHWELPFGDLKSCTIDGKKVRERASLNIEVNADGKVERTSVYDPCSP